MMVTKELKTLITAALKALRDELILDGSDPEIELNRTERAEHGDFSTNVAMAVARNGKMPPRKLAELIVHNLPPSDLVTKTEVAGPGFINFFLADTWLHGVIKQIAKSKGTFGNSDSLAGQKIQVEFVSANPTGPLHVGSGRNAAYGDAIARLLEAIGGSVSREYYINDQGKQMERFALSLEARYQQALGRDVAMPEDGYQGEYLIELGKQLADAEGMGLIGRLDEIKSWGLQKMIESHRQTLEKFGIEFDTWFSERTLHESRQVEAAIEKLTSAGATYESEGAVWLKATDAGASRDQPLRKSDGNYTYLAADAAYLLDKVGRGFDKAIYVWGADHHGNVETTIAAARFLGIDERIEIQLYQLVNFMSGGSSTRMGKRTGNIVLLDELIDEVGADAARFTFLSRSIDNTIDFDLDLVVQQSPDNPVYYVQYQHARMCSIIRYAKEQGNQLQDVDSTDFQPLTHESEQVLIKKLAEFPDAVESAGVLRAPHRLVTYAQTLASNFSAFYRDCRVLTEDQVLTQARLRLSDCSRQVLSNALGLLGVAAPDRM